MDAADRPLPDSWLSESLPHFDSLMSESPAGFPDFLVISPPKTGSTWLAANLACHPEIFIPEVKEVRYFCSFLGWLNLDWYLQHFHESGSRLKGEATPSYCVLPCQTIRLIRSLRPQVKLIFLMREPVSRAWSHAKHSYRYRENNFVDYTGSFEAIPDSKWQEHFTHDWSIVSGDYLGQLRRWLSVFPKEQVFVSFYERIESDPQTLLRELFEFLGVSPEIDFGSFRLSEKIMEGQRGEIRPVLKRYLHTIFQSRTRQLAQLLKEKFDLDLPLKWNEILNSPAEPLLLTAHAPQGEAASTVPATGRWQCRGLLSDPAAVFAREFDDDYLSDLLGMEARSTPRVVWQYRGYNIVFFLDQFFAVSQALGPLELDSITEPGLEELQARGECAVAGSLVEVEEQVDRWIYASLKPILVEEGYRGFNIVSFGEEYYAICLGDGAFDIEAAKAGKYRELFQSDSVDDLKRQIDKVAPAAVPELVEEGYYGFNIISYDGAWYGLDQGEGAFDPAKAEMQQYSRCFRSGRKEDLKEILRTEQSKAEAEKATRCLLPELVEEDYRGFNIISYDGRWYALAQGDGEFDPEKADKQQYARCFVSSSKEQLKEILPSLDHSRPAA
jgi:hypothetical protein